MENQPVSKYTAAFGLSLACCSVLNALLVIVKEKSPAMQAAMKKLTGHHWITHSAVIIMLFFALALILASLNGGRGPAMSAERLTRTIIGGIVAGGVMIVGFYLIAG